MKLHEMNVPTFDQKDVNPSTKWAFIVSGYGNIG
jgi:hypothetical protein